jgi:hypothetical protein
MFVGHLAVALGAKRASPKTSLGWLMAAATTLDLLWPVFLLTGIEHVRIVAGATPFTPLVFDSYPWSHSLLMAVGWGVVLGGLARWRGADSRAFWVLVALVVSHWVLDWASHAPDMPLWPGNSPRLGLALWSSIPGTLVIEGAIWVAGMAIYLRGRTPRSWRGPAALWSLVGISTVMWALGPWTPAPPDARSLAWFALIGWLVVPWAAWADRNYAAASPHG